MTKEEYLLSNLVSVPKEYSLTFRTLWVSRRKRPCYACKLYHYDFNYPPSGVEDDGLRGEEAVSALLDELRVAIKGLPIRRM